MSRPRRRHRQRTVTDPVTSSPRPVLPASRWFRPGYLAVAMWLLLAGAIFLYRQFSPEYFDEAAPSTDNRTTPSLASDPLRDFLGAEACAPCHREQYDLWRQSTHARAGGPPGKVDLIASFDGRPLQFSDGVVTPMMKSATEPVFVVEQPGQPRREIQVHAVVGGGHMIGGGTQSFFQRHEDGTLRFLPFDFIREEKVWFVQVGEDGSWQPVHAGLSLETDLMHWPPSRVLGASADFFNCQNCHGSQITLGYNTSKLRYQTHYQSLGINCESCHGPGRRHVELAGQPGFAAREDIGMTPLATLSKNQSLQLCWQCHATKELLTEDPYLPGKPFEDHFSIKLAQAANPFTADGRIQSFAYQASHLYSDCYLNGSMTCVDCHDPHAQTYRDAAGRPLAGRFDNGQCTACHASKIQEGSAHTHHDPGSPGSLCTSCHMPFLQHRGIGRHLKFTRSDHSIPIPRPRHDHELGIKNACQKCHADQDLDWQQAWVDAWYGGIKPHPPMVRDLILADQTTDPQAAAALLLNAEAHHPMAQMKGLLTYMERFLVPDQTVMDPQVLEPLRSFATGPDIDLQSAALMILHVGYSGHPAASNLVARWLAQPGPQEIAVKRRWAALATQVGRGLAQSGNLDEAMSCFGKALAILPGNVTTMADLALAHLRKGDAPAALAWLDRAVELEPYRAILHVQRARVLVRLRQMPEARTALGEALRLHPQNERARALLEELGGR